MNSTHIDCSVEGCDRAALLRSGLCTPHDRRVRLYGSPFGGRAIRGDPLKWVEWAAASDTDDCLDGWPFTLVSDGRPGLAALGRRSMSASRLVCIKAHGEPNSPDLHAAHSCGNKMCLNPRHIRWATAVENAHDKIPHGTHLSGELHPGAELATAQVAELRHLRFSTGESYAKLGRRFGVGRSQARRICLMESRAFG